MFQDITTQYNGADATGEILIIVLVSMALGWFVRWIYERIMFDDVYFEEHVHDFIEEEGRTISHHEDTIVRADEPSAPVAPAVPVNLEQVSAMPQPVVMPYKQDDLKIIEGIGPKIEQLLQEGGITTWQILSETDPNDIKTLLRAAGERYRIHDPSTWPEQAMLARDHKWDELEEFQDHLSGGKDLTRIYGNKG